MKPTTTTAPDQDMPLVIIECIADEPRYYLGRTLIEAVDRWRLSPANHDRAYKTLRGWMANVARRTAEWNKSVVRVDNIDNFVADLASAGVIRMRIAH